MTSRRGTQRRRRGARRAAARGAPPPARGPSHRRRRSRCRRQCRPCCWSRLCPLPLLLEPLPLPSARGCGLACLPRGTVRVLTANRARCQRTWRAHRSAATARPCRPAVRGRRPGRVAGAAVWRVADVRVSASWSPQAMGDQRADSGRAIQPAIDSPRKQSWGGTAPPPRTHGHRPKRTLARRPACLLASPRRAALSSRAGPEMRPPPQQTRERRRPSVPGTHSV